MAEQVVPEPVAPEIPEMPEEPERPEEDEEAFAGLFADLAAAPVGDGGADEE